MSQCHLELCDFSINYILNCSKCPRLSAYQDFSNIVLMTIGLSYRKLTYEKNVRD